MYYMYISDLCTLLNYNEYIQDILLYEGFPDVPALAGRSGGLWVTPDAAVPHLDGCLGSFGCLDSDLSFVCLVRAIARVTIC